MLISNWPSNFHCTWVSSISSYFGADSSYYKYKITWICVINQNGWYKDCCLQSFPRFAPTHQVRMFRFVFSPPHYTYLQGGSATQSIADEMNWGQVERLQCKIYIYHLFIRLNLCPTSAASRLLIIFISILSSKCIQSSLGQT